MMGVIAVDNEHFPRIDFFRAVVHHATHAAFIYDQHFQGLVHVQTRKTVVHGIHIRKMLKVNIIGRVSALFIQFFPSQSLIPAAKSPLLKNFILIADVKINGILERIYIAYIAPFIPCVPVILLLKTPCEINI